MQLKDNAGGHALLVGMSITIAFLALLMLARVGSSNPVGGPMSGQNAAMLHVSGEQPG